MELIKTSLLIITLFFLMLFIMFSKKLNPSTFDPSRSNHRESFVEQDGGEQPTTKTTVTNPSSSTPAEEQKQQSQNFDFLLPEIFQEEIEKSQIPRYELCKSTARQKDDSVFETKCRQSCVDKNFTLKNETDSCAVIFPQCLSKFSQKNCDTSSVALLRLLLSDLRKQTEMKQRQQPSSSSSSDFKRRCDKFLSTRCHDRHLVTGDLLVGKRLTLRKGMCLLWDPVNTSSTLTEIISEVNVQAHANDEIINTQKRIIFNVFNSSLIQKQAAQTMQANKISAKGKKALLLFDLETFPCQQQQQEPEQKVDTYNEVVIRFSRSVVTPQSSSPASSSSSSSSLSFERTILLPPLNFLIDPDSVSKHSAGILFSETFGRGLSDRVGRCGLNSWNRRSQQIGAFCGTKFYPLTTRIATTVLEAIGGKYPPTWVYSSSESSNDEDNGNTNNKTAARDSFLFAFGLGTSSIKSRSSSSSLVISKSRGRGFRPPVDWCEVSPCSDDNDNDEDNNNGNAVERRALPWSVADGFPLYRVKFAAVVETDWSTSSGGIHGRYQGSIAAGGAAPIVLSERDVKTRSSSGKRDIAKNLFGALLEEPWNTFLPVMFDVDKTSAEKTTLTPSRKGGYSSSKNLYYHVKKFGFNLQSIVNSDKQQKILQDVAENHRSIVRSMRFGSPLQSAYLSAILVLLL